MTRDATPRLLSLRPDHPDFLDLSWGVPVADWTTRCDRVEELPRGASRHPVVFVSYDVDTGWGRCLTCRVPERQNAEKTIT